MSIFGWLKCRISSDQRATWLYRRGMMRATSRKFEAALGDYTAAIDMPGVSGDVRAMALYNRALVYHAAGRDACAIHDLNQVLAMADAASDVKTEARRKLVRMERESIRIDARDPRGESHSQGGTHARIEPKTAGMHSD
jgi:hypothetical protein